LIDHNINISQNAIFYENIFSYHDYKQKDNSFTQFSLFLYNGFENFTNDHDEISTSNKNFNNKDNI